MTKQIGKYSYSPTQLIIHYEEYANLIIGKFTSIGHNVNIFLGGNHNTEFVTTFPLQFLEPIIDTYQKTQITTKGDVVIGNAVWIGMNAVIMSGVTIGDGVIIGAFSVVTKNITPYTMYAGNPARFKKNILPTTKHLEYMMEIKWWDWPEKYIIEARPLLLSNNFDGFFGYWEKNKKEINELSN